ncbi:hypothetical protein [uncultured Erythrobacter sp.]|uniref:hypothetical protein n=1 Tax=uncultured Erythrobacter sp. TaxID=263913 RepID=UPI00261A6A4D|nr:hypothetical protein [uncultured Erythrobacter sp.]
MPIINGNLTRDFSRLVFLRSVAAALLLSAGGAYAQESEQAPLSAAESATYVDLVSLAERSDMVVRVEIRRQIEVERERAPGLEVGFARLYVEARTLSLLAGQSAVGESLVYLVDVPFDDRGRPERLKDREMLLFADAVPGRPGSVQLTGRNAQLDYSTALEARLRPILTEVIARDKPPVLTGVSDALSVPGTLVGESETQIFVSTQDSSPVSITVLRRPGQRAVWGVSWGEIIDSSARPPRRETLEWYRLACSLPPRLPSAANLARDPASRRLAEDDYSFVIEQLGPCDRVITEEF